MKVLLNHDRGSNFIKEKFSIRNPKLWWPAGHGDQFLYHFNVIINSKKNQIKGSLKTGIRDVSINRKKDEAGKAFEIHVNGKPIFC